MNFEINESEAELINEALHDFGILQINALITKLGDAE